MRGRDAETGTYRDEEKMLDVGLLLLDVLTETQQQRYRDTETQTYSHKMYLG